MSAAVVLIGYDGSPDAEHAIEVAAATTRFHRAVVVHVWDPMPAAGAGTHWGPAVPTPTAEVDPRVLEERANEIAGAGAAVGRTAGLDATPELRSGAGAGGIADALLACAHEHDTHLIVVGRHGMSRVKEVLLGSVSTALIRDGSFPVLVVPVDNES